MSEQSLPPSSTASSARKNSSWIEGFVEYTSGNQSPELFRRWAAVSIVAGVLERRVWARITKWDLYPNLYVLLVGGPGVGKTDAIRACFDFWDTIPSLFQAPSNVSSASLIDCIAKAERTILRPTEKEPFTKFNSLSVSSDEFGVFLKQYEGSFMSTLNKLYDGTRYTEEKRGMKEGIRIDHPLLNMIAGTTPAWLGSALPETAWAEGFSSRLILVYSGERKKVDLFVESSFSEIHAAKLNLDLKQIHGLFGKMAWEPEVVAALQAWYMGDCQPVPDHPKLEHYLPRRHIHLIKLAIIMSASRGNDMVIRMCDYQAAMDLFIETEATMPEVFKAMRYNSDGNVIDECFNFIYVTFTKEGKAIPEHRITHFLAQRMPSHQIKAVLDTMVNANYIKIAALGVGGRNTYAPVPKIERG